MRLLLCAALYAFLIPSAAGAAPTKKDSDPGGLSSQSAQHWSDIAVMEELIVSMRALRDAVPADRDLPGLLTEHKRLTLEFKSRLKRAVASRHRYSTLARALQSALLFRDSTTKAGGKVESDPAYAAILAQESEVNRMRSHREDIGRRFEAEDLAFGAALEARRAAGREWLWLGIAGAVIPAAFLAAWLKLR